MKQVHDFSDFNSKGADAPKKKSKFKNKRTEYNGVWYQSGWEAEYARRLDELFMLPAGDPKRPTLIERQVGYPISHNGLHMFSYFADFRVTYPGRVDVVDVKGVKTDVYRLKKKFVEHDYKLKIKEIKI